MTMFEGYWQSLPESHPLKARQREFPSTYEASRDVWLAALRRALGIIERAGDIEEAKRAVQLEVRAFPDNGDQG